MAALTESAVTVVVTGLPHIAQGVLSQYGSIRSWYSRDKWRPPKGLHRRNTQWWSPSLVIMVMPIPCTPSCCVFGYFCTAKNDKMAIGKQPHKHREPTSPTLQPPATCFALRQISEHAPGKADRRARLEGVGWGGMEMMEVGWGGLWKGVGWDWAPWRRPGACSEI